MRITIKVAAAVAAITLAGAAGGFVASTSGGVGAANNPPAGLVTTLPARVLDTRTGAKPALNSTTVVNTGITGAVAVAVNITLTETDGAGFVTAWDGLGARPNVSIINSFGAGQTIANYAIVPVDAAGKFNLFVNNPGHLLVDVMGYFPGSAALVPAGLTATITGYAPGSTITSVTGSVTNGGSVSKTVRVDIKCPNGTVETDTVFQLGAGQTKGFSVLCGGGAFTSGASVQAVLET